MIGLCRMKDCKRGATASVQWEKAETLKSLLYLCKTKAVQDGYSTDGVCSRDK